MSIDKIPEYTIFKAGADDTPAIRIPIRAKEIPDNRIANLVVIPEDGSVSNIKVLSVTEFEIMPLAQDHINLSRLMRIIEDLLLSAFAAKFDLEKSEVLIGHRHNSVFSITLVGRDKDWHWTCEYPIDTISSSYSLGTEIFFPSELLPDGSELKG